MESNAVYLDSRLGNLLPALEHEFQITLKTLHDNTVKTVSAQKAEIILFTALDVNFPKTGFNFNSSLETFGFVEASLEATDTLKISYWDTKELVISRVIENHYRRQLNEKGLLKEDYNKELITIEYNSLILTLSNCAITRPIPISLSSSSNNLQKMAFNAIYEDYKHNYTAVQHANYSIS